MAMDTFKGWPLDGALTLNLKPKDGEDIVAGMFVYKDTNGELVKGVGAAGERAYFALENQDDYAVIGAQKMAVVTHNAIMLTDQYDAGGSYDYKTPLEVDSANPGKVKPHTGGGAPVVAYADGFETRDDIEYLKVHIGS